MCFIVVINKVVLFDTVRVHAGNTFNFITDKDSVIRKKKKRIEEPQTAVSPLSRFFIEVY